MTLYRTILLVDDDTDDQELFIDAVNEVDASIHCFCANDGEAALKFINEDAVVKPDMVFIDLNMPKLNGKRVLQELKKTEIIKSIPVIMYSTFFGPRDIEEINASGASFHMVKSTRFEDLCKSLQHILSKAW
jgi:CheY-like chemotaxis protein